LKALVVITGAPNWALNGFNPRGAFIDNAVKKTLDRYTHTDSVAGFQIWNEPNMVTDENKKMGFIDRPESYVEVAAEAYRAKKRYCPNKLIVSAASTSIIQNYRDTIKYNEKLIAAGLQDQIDVFAFHYYGDSYFNWARPYGALEFLKKIEKPIWITELGTAKFGNHESYARTRIPYLKSKLSKLENVFWYQYTSAVGDEDYGLIKYGPSSGELSGLYNYLVNRK
jgi:hypothetical protein